ncbi:MAG: glycosyl hydrolase [Cytophagales bacterium]|nr:glycosyl hydrolase [Cytophagales bacterium]
MKHLSALTFLTLLLCSSLLAQDLNELLSPVKYRNIGPFRGGRSVCATGVVGDQLTYYMGTTGGGLWKTDDAGQIWENISDGFFKTGSVGAIAVSESDPNVVYCGMGEHAPRGVMTSYGDGVYKSTDAGKTWKQIGLTGTQHIARIVIHPKNPDILWVAAQGPLHGNGEDRGIYKSTDGGVSWKKVLYVNDMTGCAELSIDYSNPDVLYAAMWEHQRKPWIVISGGAGSGLYKSTDGGETWNKIHKGLPEEKGKMAIAVSRSNPEKVYALIESDSQQEKGGLFVSNNAGKSWSKVSGDHRLIQRAWYYIELFIDPKDDQTVYVLSAPALRSIDGGKSWERITGTHGDFHDLWINPDNPRNMVIANDGGAAISFNYGSTWSRQDNMPTAQYYRVSADNMFPYRIYAGQQDNTSLRIENTALGRYSITRENWTYSAGGESAFLAYDPDDPRYVLGGSYLGTINVLDQEAKAGTNIMAAPIQYLGRAASDMKYRFNWNAPIIRSQHEENTFYHGSQFLLRTRDMGQTWEEASPDLTKNDKSRQIKGGGPYTVEAVGAENYGTLAYVIESPHEAGVIWTGSDDGLVQLTRDNGETWTNVTPKGLEDCLVNAIDVSPHDPATAYVATTRYKFNDHTPAMYKTTNYGKSWTNISTGIPYGAFTRVVREDDVKQGLLYAGTELGLYVSFNDGKQWQPLQLNLPVTPITDLLVKEGDLVVATSGRSFWILDDLSLIRQFDASSKATKLFTPQDAILANWGSPMDGNRSDGTDRFEGINPASGVVFYYQLGEVAEEEEVTLTINDNAGNEVRVLSSKSDPDYRRYAGGPPSEPTIGARKGMNRFVWDMRYANMPGVPTAYIEGSYRRHRVIPGTYSATLKAGAVEQKVTFKVLEHPLYDVSEATYQEYHESMSEMEDNLTAMHNMINDLKKKQDQIAAVVADLGADKKALKDEGQALIDQLKAWDEDMVQRKSKAYDDVENYENKFTANYIFLINQTASAIPRVTQASKDRRAELEQIWAPLKERGEKLQNESVPAYNQALWKAGIGAIK